MKVKIAAKVCVLILVGGLAASTVHWNAFEGFHRAISLAYARVTELLVEALGLPVYADGSFLYTFGSNIRITRDCNGLVPFVLLVSASLLMSLPWKRRLGLAAFLGITILAFNELRILTFFLIKTHNPRAAHIFHDVFIPLFLFVIFAGLWMKWLQHEGDSRKQNFPRGNENVIHTNAFGTWERIRLGLALVLVVLFLADLFLKGSGILPHCPRIGKKSSYLFVLCLGLIGWVGVVVLLWKRRSKTAELLVGAFTGVHAALFGRLIVASSLCTTCVAAAVLSLLVFTTFPAQGRSSLSSFAALIVGIGVTQGIYFIISSY